MFRRPGELVKPGHVTALICRTIPKACSFACNASTAGALVKVAAMLSCTTRSLAIRSESSSSGHGKRSRSGSAIELVITTELMSRTPSSRLPKS